MYVGALVCVGYITDKKILSLIYIVLFFVFSRMHTCNNFFLGINYYDKLSFDKNNKNRAFWGSFGQIIYYPYSVIGNKYEKWFDEYYDWISEFQSLYNWDKTKNQFQNSLRLMDNEEYNRILESNENQNPSWPDKADIWKRFSINPLYDGKDYNLVSSVFNFVQIKI